MLGLAGGLTICPVPAIASVAQQTLKVSGQVVDQDGEALIGASVIVKSEKGQGVVTDVDGKFALQTKKEAPLTKLALK